MSQKTIQLAVLLREVYDPRPPVRLTPDAFSMRERGLRPLANPADLCALEKALRLAEEIDANVSVFAVGPSRLEDLLRLGLSMGAQRAIRIWHPSCAGGDVAADARLLQRIIEIIGCDFFMTGSRLLDRGADPAPALAALRHGLPYVTSVLDFEFQTSGLRVMRKSDRGAKQVVELEFPCCLLVEEGGGELRYPDQDALMSALSAEIDHWGLAELGLAPSEIGSSAAVLGKERFAFPRLKPKRVVTPDAHLPAFDRILALLSGGIKPRAGTLHHVNAEETVDGLMAIFADQGLLHGETQ